MLCAIISEFLVDFIGENEDVFFGGDFGQGAKLIAGVDRASRIAGRIDDDHLRARSHRIFEVFSGELPVVLLAGLNDDGLTADETNHLGIAEPIGGRNDDFITFIHHSGDGIEAGLLGTIAHDHLAGLVV